MRRRLLVPEAIQTSAMDCGPASLAALLGGFGIHASYGRLREACQTSVDGTSIDALETAAIQLGLDATQVMVPADHLLAREAELLPALAVARLPGGATHFVVLWRRHGRWVQIMDPGRGRRWVPARRVVEDLYIHTQPVPVEAWREWSAADAFLAPLAGRIRRIGGAAERLIRSCDSARLDAAVRLVEHLVDCGGARRGREAASILDKAAASSPPHEYWSAAPSPEDPSEVVLRGAVLLQVHGRRATTSSTADLNRELSAAVEEKPARPLAELLRAVPALGAVGIAAALAPSAAAVVVQALLLRGFFEIGRELANTGARLAAIAAVLAFCAALLALDYSIARGVLRLSRILEVRLRLRFLAKIPRLADRYFHSRPISDMADRAHNAHVIRNVPELASGFLRAVFEMTFIAGAIAWLYPEAAGMAAVLALTAAGIPIVAQPLLAERDLRVRVHCGALTRFYLDALLGLTAIRAHDASRAIRHEQAVLLTEWARAARALQRAIVGLEGLQFAATVGLGVWTVWGHLSAGHGIGGVLLLVYWVLNLPALGQEAAAAAWQYPWLRNSALRLIEPLGAPEEPRAESAPAIEAAPNIVFDAVRVEAGGHTILDAISLDIPAGQHVAVVGPSGAGKSSLAGLLLGWHRPAAGSVRIDSRPLDVGRLDALRRSTAWVDPQVQIWNRSLGENLREPSAALLEHAGLHRVLGKLSEGLDTVLGEGGALLSGGEGQRVRFGRALAQTEPALVILDEPARGLDRRQRRSFIENARKRWHGATILTITHDIEDTLTFDRVLVIDHGRIVEDGAPATLASDRSSRYRALLDAEDNVRRNFWSSANWRRLRLDGGKLTELEGESTQCRIARLTA
jgi:ABC-type bacteriocin/lantibiotic exporter with double-glycine peptidase domain